MDVQKSGCIETFCDGVRGRSAAETHSLGLRGRDPVLPQLSSIMRHAVRLLLIFAFASTSFAQGIPGPGEVAVFKHSNYDGTCRILVPGNYHSPRAMGFPTAARCRTANVGGGANLLEHRETIGAPPRGQPGACSSPASKNIRGVGDFPKRIVGFFSAKHS